MEEIQECFLIHEKDVRNIECPITFEPIAYGDKYRKCSSCKWNFSNNSIEKFLTNSYLKNKKCPMCRCEWYNNIIYINKSSTLENLYKIKLILIADKNTMNDIFGKKCITSWTRVISQK